MDVLSNIWDFIQIQLLGMKWLNDLVGYLLNKVNINVSSKLGGSLHFFIYDVIKIIILLCVLILLFHIFKVTFLLKEARK